MPDQNNADAQLREYLMQDIALHKMRLSDAEKKNGKWLFLIVALVFMVMVCVGGFSATMYFVAKEHTKQIEAIFAAKIEVVDKVENEHVYQEDITGAAIINNKSTNTTNAAGTSTITK